MKGIDVHGFRKTHRTWAEAKGVPPALIDKQLGHDGIRAQESREEYRMLMGSKTGRKHYLDLSSKLLDATRSAKAVRELLDLALADVEEGGTVLLEPWTPASARIA